jgi:phosphonoacetaldehyde hydrolase
MGMAKRSHIAELLRLPGVIEQWCAQGGAGPEEADLDRLYSEFIVLQSSILVEHADVIPGAVETMEALRSEGILLGSTTGYSRAMMDILEPEVWSRGLRFDAVVTPDEVPSGRPAPWMALAAAMRLSVYPLSACVKVGDTVVDIQEGLNGGMWTAGVTETGNEMGLSEAELEALPPKKREQMRRDAGERLTHAGAHFVIDGVGKMPDVIEEINTRLARGERP